jgi:predicted Zn-dependent protease
MDEAEEIKLGEDALKQIINSVGMTIERGTERAKRVEKVGKAIAAVAERPDFKWEFYTLRRDELNAFCLPGGKIFFYSKMVDFTEGDDAEVAIVMGHEVAHALARHGAERMSQDKLAGTSLSIGALAVSTVTKSQDLANRSARLASAVLNLGVLLPYSRLHESVADYIGAILAAKAGYDPRAAIRFWERMSSASKGKEPFFFLSTHPVYKTRIEDLQEIMDEALKYYHPKDIKQNRKTKNKLN